ncbi:unnamed protein product [Protopolystoma xenopodis]|uniref:Uncharacterized protein n=1 Tax=Protopolystoma xenopodis TaxID=117903 RepID=A0A3S5FC93_9PLAT|nr:unnamed protein product [Protopolystoma xenopodis]
MGLQTQGLNDHQQSSIWSLPWPLHLGPSTSIRRALPLFLVNLGSIRVFCRNFLHSLPGDDLYAFLLTVVRASSAGILPSHLHRGQLASLGPERAPVPVDAGHTQHEQRLLTTLEAASSPTRSGLRQIATDREENGEEVKNWSFDQALLLCITIVTTPWFHSANVSRGNSNRECQRSLTSLRYFKS